MDEIIVGTTKSKHELDDSNLPAVMASLELLSVDNATLPPSPGNKRILRKRIPKAVPNEILNRRCSRRPKKRTSSEMESEEDIKEYYLDKNLKKRPNSLETIYEEKDEIRESSIYMSAKRYKRMIEFQPKPSDSKLRKRRAKIKKVFGSKVNFKKRCASMQILLDKLNGIRAESPGKIDNEVK
ncbi:hypothetical protein KM043_015489 [Ampulex compressa]|nr:hypothetical protein KM043_015489 [Ampulex compressa]